MAGRPETTEAIVLDSIVARDDRVVTLLTPEHGRIAALARRATRSQRRFGGHIDPITRVEATLTLRPRGGMATFERASARDGYGVIKGDLPRLVLASSVVEVVLLLVPEHGQEPGVYPLLCRALDHLNQPSTDPTEDLLLLFELRMLRLAGVLPHMDDVDTLGDGPKETLAGWLRGQWTPLAHMVRPAVARFLEGLVEDAGGRPLKSRALLDEVLDAKEP